MERLVDIETEFTSFVKRMGGTIVEERLSKSPNFSNADYYFGKPKVVAELKCLCDNKKTDVGIKKKLTELYYTWTKAGLIKELAKDESKLNTRDLPESCKAEVYEVYQKPIRKRINKANKQIRETKIQMGWDDCAGLLLIANDGNFALEMDALVAAVSNCLRSDFSSIDMVVIFTSNMLARSPGLKKDLLAWVNLYRPNKREICKEFMESLHICWHKHLECVLGSSIPCVGKFPQDALSGIKYIDES